MPREIVAVINNRITSRTASGRGRSSYARIGRPIMAHRRRRHGLQRRHDNTLLGCSAAVVMG